MEENIPNVAVHLRALDCAMLVLYAFGVLGAGWFYNRRNKTADDYLVGGSGTDSSDGGPDSDRAEADPFDMLLNVEMVLM